VGRPRHFIARSLEALRPGGIGAFVCSRYLMDGSDRAARERIAELADLIGAVRLPAASMRAEAGTDVVVDLLFFKRRDKDAHEHAQDWLEVAAVPGQFGGRTAPHGNQPTAGVRAAQGGSQASGGAGTTD
jgi:hypothetical protein